MGRGLADALVVHLADDPEVSRDARGNSLEKVGLADAAAPKLASGRFLGDPEDPTRRRLTDHAPYSRQPYSCIWYA